MAAAAPGDGGVGDAVAAGPPLPADPVLSAVRLTGGIGGAMAVASVTAASILMNQGKCSEVAGALSVGLLGAMLMFSGMLPVTQGDATRIVFATGILQFVIIVVIAAYIIRILTLAKVCPTLQPGQGCKSKSISEFRRGMAKASAGMSLLAIIYLLMVVPGPNSGFEGLIEDLLGRVQTLGGHLHNIVGGNDVDLGDGAGARNLSGGANLTTRLQARMQAFLKAFWMAGRGALGVVIATVLLGTGMILPSTGIDAMASACSKTTAG